MIPTTETRDQQTGTTPRQKCHRATPKWAILVNDIVVPVPQQLVLATVLRSQAAISHELALVRDHNSPEDVVVDEGATIDLAKGNVFYTIRREEATTRGVCKAPPKLAYFVDDHAEITTNPDQSGRTIRELFNLDAANRLVRDYESPVDESVGLEESASFTAGPVFFTRQATPTVIIVNGKRRRVTTLELTFAELIRLAFAPPPSGENICFTVTYRGGPCANPEGSLLEGQSVKITEGMVFNVTATDKS